MSGQLSKLVVAAAVTGALAVAIVAPRTTRAAGPSFFSTTSTFRASSCPFGWKLTGGGVGPLPQNSYSSFSSTEYTLNGSYPSGSSWQARATVTRGTYSSTSGWRFSSFPYVPTIYVVCAR